MPLPKGPPLPRSMEIFWPWYKPPEVEIPPEAVPPPEVPEPPVGYYSLYLYIVGKGAVTPGSGNYPAGSTITLTAMPGPGYVFGRWAGDVSGTRPSVNITMSRTRTATAYFKVAPEEEIPYVPPEEEVPYIPPEEEPPPSKAPKVPASDIANLKFQAVRGTYDLGDKVPYEVAFDYKGKGQGGSLTILLGTGIYPSFFTKHTFPQVRVSFEEAYDWRAHQLSGTFTIPSTLEHGQTYSVRATLRTDDGAQEIDTDWTVITIPELPAPPPPAPPAPPVPSSLLIEYQALLEQAITAVDDGLPKHWLMIPGYGLQEAWRAVPQLKQLMINEAINIGLIDSASEVFFPDEAHLYCNSFEYWSHMYWSHMYRYSDCSMII